MSLAHEIRGATPFRACAQGVDGEQRSIEIRLAVPGIGVQIQGSTDKIGQIDIMVVHTVGEAAFERIVAVHG